MVAPADSSCTYYSVWDRRSYFLSISRQCIVPQEMPFPFLEINSTAMTQECILDGPLRSPWESPGKDRGLCGSPWGEEVTSSDCLGILSCSCFVETPPHPPVRSLKEIASFPKLPLIVWIDLSWRELVERLRPIKCWPSHPHRNCFCLWPPGAQHPPRYLSAPLKLLVHSTLCPLNRAFLRPSPWGFLVSVCLWQDSVILQTLSAFSVPGSRPGAGVAKIGSLLWVTYWPEMEADRCQIRAPNGLQILVAGRCNRGNSPKGRTKKT